MEEEGYCNTRLGLGLGGESYVPWPKKQKEKPVVRLDLSFTLCPDQEDSMNIDHHDKEEKTCFKSEEDEDYGNKRSEHSIDNSCMYGTGRKKLRLTKDQSSYLEESFRRHPALNPNRSEGKNLHSSVCAFRALLSFFHWFLFGTKLKQTEADCEFLKKCCESLSNENRRLKRELQELRSQKTGRSPSHSQLAKDFGTITKCPSCEESTTTDQKNCSRF
ncbi:hypothetical protein NC651_014710 [Populus alba x Populus x berolinensis]|nr:hypothetical protein NC651_014710 [Populus alba x Populus x berolinensis]